MWHLIASRQDRLAAQAALGPLVAVAVAAQVEVHRCRAAVSGPLQGNAAPAVLLLAAAVAQQQVLAAAGLAAGMAGRGVAGGAGASGGTLTNYHAPACGSVVAVLLLDRGCASLQLARLCFHVCIPFQTLASAVHEPLLLPPDSLLCGNQASGG